MVFTAPLDLPAGGAPYDVYVFRSNNPAHEIHRPEFAGTAAMDTGLFGTADDGSTPTRHFVDRQGLPAAIQLPEEVDFPAEEESIALLFPNIVSFAASGGTQDLDFYLRGVVRAQAYADAQGLPAAGGRFLNYNHVPAATGCISAWGKAVQFGATRNLYAYSSVMAPNGDVIVTGYIDGAFPGLMSGGGLDVVVARYDGATGAQVWEYQLGGVGDDVGRDVAFGPGGELYITGETTSSSFLGQPTAGGADAFVLALDSNGALLWSRVVGGSGNDTGYGVAVRSDGAVFIGGATNSPSIPGGPVVTNTPTSILAAFNGGGVPQWVVVGMDAFSPANHGYTLDIAVDEATGDVVAVGAERRFDQSGNAAENPFVTRYSGTDGALLWTHHLGGHGYYNSAADSRHAYAYGVAVDPFDGAVYVAGTWYAGSSVGKWGDWTRASGDTSGDAYVAKIDAAGGLDWTYTVASTERADDIGESVFSDGVGGRVYLAGRTAGSLPGQSSQGGEDFLLAAFSYAGAQLWAVQGGTGAHDAGQVAAALMQSQSSGVVYLVSNTTGALDGVDRGKWDIGISAHDLGTGAQQALVIASRLTWQTGAWSACSTSCGTGTQTRALACVREDGVTVPNAYCVDATPASSQACTVTAGCSYTWQSAAWSACSNACGSGTQTRTVFCQRSDGTPVADTFCSGSAPATSQSCSDTSACTYAWSAGAWSTCSATCGGGTQTRTVYCQRSDGGQVADSFCSGAKPGSSQSCNTQACALAQSCRTLYDQGIRTSGRYNIDPDGAGPRATLNVYCDMSNAGGGWTNVDFSTNRVWLENNNYVQCRNGITSTGTAFTCNAPFFNNDSNSPMYHYLCSGTDRSAHYILEHMGLVIGHRASASLGFASQAQSYDGQAGTSSGSTSNPYEKCYINGQVVGYATSACAAYAGSGNGNCIPGYFTLSL